MPGASIRIFLPDGNPESLRLVSRSHWTGVAVSGPRGRYAEARQRDELRKPGVYVLIGPPEDPNFQARIYVGEGEDPRARIDIHQANKDFWTRFVVFSSQGPQTLNKGTLRYIEAQLLQLAAAAGRVELDNGNSPGVPPLHESEAADAKAFVQDMLVIYPLLSVSAFEPPEEPVAVNWLHLAGPDAEGTGAETDEGFLVKEGAFARALVVESMPSWAAAIRHALVDSGVLVPVGGQNKLRLSADHLFASPSAAAAVLLGRSAAGPLEWKDGTGKPLRRLREEALGP